MQGGEESAAATAENPGAADAAQGNEGTADDGGADQGGSNDEGPVSTPASVAWPFPKSGRKAVAA
ncbi:MAG: hypothetical protein DCF26_20305 [Burkholderiales bacterium]|nr:MAG: hypothetical protein DCF26_20305 [Burkholderiales bacterium]